MKDRNGKTCLFINRMTDSDAGYYTCVAKNEHGEEKKTIKVVKAGKFFVCNILFYLVLMLDFFSYSILFVKRCSKIHKIIG